MHNSSLITLVKEILGVFYNNKKKQFYLLLLVIFLSSIADVISFTMIVPLIYIINDSSAIQHIKVFQLIYNNMHFDGPENFILLVLFGLVLVFLIKNIFLLFSVYIQNKFVYDVADDILNKQIMNFYNNDYLDVRRNNTIEYLRCLLEAPQGFADVLMMPVVFVLNEALVVGFIFIALLYYKPLIVILLLTTIVPIGYLLIHTAKKKLQENSDNRSEKEKEAYMVAVESINAYTDVKLFGKEKIFQNSVLDVFNGYYNVLVRRNVYVLAPRRIIEVLVVATVCVIYVIASFWLHVSKDQMVLILLAFSTAAYRVLPSLNEIVTNIVRIKTSSYILDLLRFIKAPDTYDRKLQPICFNEKIELNNICYQYDEGDGYLLDNINLSVKKGEFVLLTGDSGAGKTTIGKILTGFIRPNDGKYSVDGKEVRHINQIKRYIGYVTQDFYLFDKTLLENIAIGEMLEEIDYNKIENIVNYTNLKEFVDSLPMGLHQRIGEMGTKLSGGQRQRIAIARALYKDIEFLVLDEATSSLDKENEEQIIDTIYKISKDRNITVLLITHRVSSVRRFDSIYEIRDGHLFKVI